MLIAHVVDRLDGIGGVQTYLADLLSALAARGVAGTVVTEYPADEAVDGVDVHTVPGVQDDGPALRPAVHAALSETLARARPDVCIVHIAPSPGVLAACSDVAPTLVFAHDYFMTCPGNARYLERSRRFCHEGPGLRCFVRAYTERTTNRDPRRLAAAYVRQRAWRTAWSQAAGIVVASPFVRDALVEHGVAREQIAVIPYFVPMTDAADAERDIDVLFLGRLVPMKGASVLVDALSLLEGRTATIAGAGPESASLTERVARHGLADRVRLLGPVGPDERQALLARARVFALPSLWAEPFGIAGLEALAAGVPVVASTVGGIPSWLPSSEAGIGVPPGSAEALAAGLSEMLVRASAPPGLRAQARAAAAAFSIERHVERLLEELRLRVPQ